MKNKATATQLKKWHKLAVQVSKKAYAPYSKHHVGSCIVLSNGKTYVGCNVENASYGGTVCAERNAVFNAVANHGKIKIAHVVVVTNNNPPWPPCGFCRQVLAEFSDAQTMVHISDLKRVHQSLAFAELLPSSFNPSHFKTRTSSKS